MFARWVVGNCQENIIAKISLNQDLQQEKCVYIIFCIDIDEKLHPYIFQYLL